MTLKKHEDKQICSILRISFLSESPTPNGLPKHLDIVVYKAIGIRVDVFQYHLSSHRKLEQRDQVIHRFIGFINWLYLFLALFIQFGGFTYRIYLLTLFISFIYPLGLFIRFGRFFLPYLRALVLMYTVFIPIAISVSFCHISERSTFALSSIYISNVRMKNIFRFPLRHHLCLIKPTTLQ